MDYWIYLLPGIIMIRARGKNSRLKTESYKLQEEVKPAKSQKTKVQREVAGNRSFLARGIIYCGSRPSTPCIINRCSRTAAGESFIIDIYCPKMPAANRIKSRERVRPGLFENTDNAALEFPLASARIPRPAFFRGFAGWRGAGENMWRHAGMWEIWIFGSVQPPRRGGKMRHPIVPPALFALCDFVWPAWALDIELACSFFKEPQRWSITISEERGNIWRCQTGSSPVIRRKHWIMELHMGNWGIMGRTGHSAIHQVQYL